jgi:S1-C subfamily serine protease
MYLKRLTIAGLLAAFLFLFQAAAIVSVSVENNHAYALLPQEELLIEAIEKARPTVATIRTQVVINYEPTYPPYEDPLLYFFELMPIIFSQSRNEQNIGSGIIINDKVILTSKHVVQNDKANYAIVTVEGGEFPVTRVIKDAERDLAILVINGKNLVHANFGDSDSLNIGQFTIAIGTPLGTLHNSVTTGIVSGLGRNIKINDPASGLVEEQNLIQTSAAINLGNSGGGLFNSSGEVIGVNIATTAFSENIGFAIPINEAVKFLNANPI